MNTHTRDAVQYTSTVPLPAARAFALFTDGLASWWPQEYTWAADTLDTIVIEPRENGRCFERGPHNFACDWGRVLTWEPPQRLVMTWQISPTRVPEPNPAKASEIEIRFVEEEPSITRIEFEHHGFARHGEGNETYREVMASKQGWPYILGRYAAAAAR